MVNLSNQYIGLSYPTLKPFFIFNMRDSFIIYRSFYEAICDLDADSQAQVFKAICEYSLNFKEIELTGVAKTIFRLIKPQLDANNKRYENGKQPKTKPEKSETEAKEKQNESETEANKNVNDNVNDNDNKNNNLNDNDITISDKSEKKQISYKQWTLEDFQNEMSKYKPNYPVEILMQFYDYWRELTPSGKMKLQLEKSWQTDLRVEKWFKNSHNFAPKNQKQTQKHEMGDALKESLIFQLNKIKAQ